MKRVTDETLQRRTNVRSLFDLPPVAAANHSDDEATLDIKFAAWLDANPHVLNTFIEFALRAQRSGRRRIGAKRIVEQMRWDAQTPTTGDVFRLNNNFVSRLARAAVGVRPELEPLFEFRELRS